MDFPAQGLEGRPASYQSLPSSSDVPDGYFAVQALWAGYFDVAGDIRRAELTGEGVSAREILQRELLKERMRSDIILRELARVRMLEEEVTRELETERALAMRRHHKEFVSSFGIAPDISEKRVLLTHSAPEVVEQGVVVARVDTDRSDRETLFGERMVEKSCPTRVPQIYHKKNSAVSQFSPTEVRRELETERVLAMQRHRKEFVSSFGIAPQISEKRVLLMHSVPEIVEQGVVMARVDTDNFDREKLFGERMVEQSCPTRVPQIDYKNNSAVSAFSPTAKLLTAGLGVKRKASELLGITRKKTGGPAMQDWSRALCHVGATSREALNEHLQGRRHQTNAELMGIVKNTGDSTSAKGADSPLPVAKARYQSQKQQKIARLRCELCNVECSSSSMLAHLGGRKHRTRLEKSQAATTKLADEKETAVELQGSEARDEAGV